MLDKRVWKPDGTCLPFNLESIHGAPTLGDVFIFFSLPSHMVMIITSLTTFGASASREAQNIRLRRGSGGDTLYHAISRGSLLNVTEFTNLGASSPPGWANAMQRTCRYILQEPGDYEFYWGGSANGANAGIAVSGFVFPRVDV